MAPPVHFSAGYSYPLYK